MQRPCVALAVLIGLGVAAAPAAPAAASPLSMFGIGGDSPGRAGTGAADASGFECVYLNPAGLAGSPRKRLTFGTLLGTFELEGVERSVDAAVGVEIGAALRLPLGGSWKDRIGLGFGFYVPTQVINKARAPMPGTPFYALLENRAQTVGLQVGAGVRIDERWAVGASFLALAALSGHIHVSTDAGGRFITTSEQQLLSHFAPILGVRWKAAPRLETGATFRFASRSAYDILVTNELGETLPVTLPELRFAGIAQYDPMTLLVEGAWWPGGGGAGGGEAGAWLITGQLAWERWSAFPLPTENPVEGMPAQEAPGFHDTLVPRVGVERRVGAGGLDLRLRAGYFFAWSPAPEMTGQQALLDNHRHVGSIGVGLHGPTQALPFYVDAWFQTHVLVGRHHDRPDGQDDVDTGGAIFVGGFTLGADL